MNWSTLSVVVIFLSSLLLMIIGGLKIKEARKIGKFPNDAEFKKLILDQKISDAELFKIMSDPETNTHLFSKKTFELLEEKRPKVFNKFSDPYDYGYL